MSPGQGDAVAADVQRMIKREQEIISGTRRMRESTRNPVVRQQLDTQLAEAQRNLSYLEDRFKRLTVVSENKVAKSTRPEEKATRLDLLRYDLGNSSHVLMAPRVQLMLQQLEYKMSIEQQYKQATQKLLQLYTQTGDRRSKHEAAENLDESQAKIAILTRSIKRYSDMHLPVDDAEAEDLVDDFKVPNQRRPLQGTLNVFVREVADVDHSATWTRDMEMIVAIKADRVGAAWRTRPSRSSQFGEEFRIPVDRANEIEFAVYDRDPLSHAHQHGTPVALLWLRIADIVEAQRRKRVQRDLEASGWASAKEIVAAAAAGPSGAAGNSNAGSSAAADVSGIPGGSHSATDGVVKTDNVTGGPQDSAAVSGAAANTEDVTVEGWFTLEPAGRVYLRLAFDRGTPRKRPRPYADEQRLGRHNAIRKREETQEVHGHEMVHHQAYNIVRCSVCGDFATSHYQCQDCRLSCDRKCLGKIVAKCTAFGVDADLEEGDDELSHRIPHRWEPCANMRANWCCHCGYILPLASKKNVSKCSECGMMCHATCSRHVPNFCGMSMEMASQIVNEIKSTRIRQATKAVARLSLPASSDLSLSGTSAPSSASASRAPPLLHGVVGSGSKQAPAPPPPRPAPPSDGQLLGHEQYWPYGTGKPIASKTPSVRMPPKEPVRRKEVGSAPSLGPILPGEESEDSWLLPLREDTASAPQSQTQQDTQPPHAQTESSAATRPPSQPPQPVTPTKTLPFSDGSRSSPTRSLAPTHSSESQTSPQAAHHAAAAAAAAAITGRGPQSSPPAHKSPSKSGAAKKRRRKVGLDDFSFLAVLGKGNFGKVMLAESKASGGLYAVKVLKKNFIIENREVESTRSEKRVFLIANRERHPFLVNLMACFQTENRIYFVMEYISGGDLMYHIQKEMFTARRAQFYAAEVLLALKHFHENDVIYRDLKLDNILLGLDGHIKVADYGLCKEEMGYGKTTGTFCGTPDFIAPEILLDQKYGGAVDWWALGVLMYQMLLGKSPFHGADEDEVYDAILSDEPLYPIHMPRESVSILQLLLTRDPSKRLGSGPRDALEIMEHPYFANIDFEALLARTVEPPYKPVIDSPTDVRYFDHDFTSEMPALTPMNSTLTPQMQEQFRGFSYAIGDSI